RGEICRVIGEKQYASQVESADARVRTLASRRLSLNRRRFLKLTSLGSGAVLSGFETAASRIPEPEEKGEGSSGGPFVNEGLVERDAAFGNELDGRLYSSLGRMDEKNLVTPEERFYLRTRASRILPEAGSWKVKVDGLTAAKRSVWIAEFESLDKPLGLHLVECAGN